MRVDCRNVEAHKFHPTAISYRGEFYYGVEWDFQIGQVH